MHRSTAFDNRQPLIIDQSLWDVICILIQRHIAWVKNSIDYSLYVYSRLPYFKGLAETRVHLPQLETSMSMAAMLQYMVRIMKMKQLVGQQFTSFKAFMVLQDIHNYTSIEKHSLTRKLLVYRIDQWWCKKHGNKSDRNLTGKLK